MEIKQGEWRQILSVWLGRTWVTLSCVPRLILPGFLPCCAGEHYSRQLWLKGAHRVLALPFCASHPDARMETLTRNFGRIIFTMMNFTEIFFS